MGRRSLDELGRAALAAAVAFAFVFGCSGGGGAPADAVKRVTLTGNYATSTTGQGWNLENERIALDAADTDFALSMTMVIMLHPRQPQVAFCEQLPPGGVGRFTSVQEVPGDVAACTSWTPADLGGNTPNISNYIGGQGFVVRNRDAVPVAKMMIVSGSIVDADVQVTFDMQEL